MYTKRQELEILRAQLESERSSFMGHWADLGKFILPRRPRFTLSDTNRGDRRSKEILDTTATFAARTLRSGLMSGVTSPARPWFRLSTPDPALSESGAVKAWLYWVTQRMTTVFTKSNLYNVLPIAYGDMGVFGTAAIYMEPDLEQVVRFYSFPIGSYCISNSGRMTVDTFQRTFRLSVRQVLERYARDPQNPKNIDWSKVSLNVRALTETKSYETWIDVCHTIRPNPQWNPRYLDAKYKRYESTTYETGSQGKNSNYLQAADSDRYLKESGLDFFPVLVPRWEINGEDSYGTDCPGMTTLPDVKQLQAGEKRGLQALDKMVNPPMKGPTSLAQQAASILPGGMTFLDEREGGGKFQPVHEVNFRLDHLENKQAQVRNRIQRGFYEDLFLMLAESDRRQITAREVQERHEEKLLALGPVLEQLNQDLLDPLIENTFQIMLDRGLIPRPPRELEGQDLKVEYLSIMAQAQKLVGSAGIERFAGFVGNVASQTQNPETLDKVNVDQLIDAYGDLTSVPPGIIRPDDEVAQIRANRQRQAAAMQQATMLREGAGAARDLSQASMEGDNALTRLAQASQAGQAVAIN